jgi:arylsulfatase A-like enzyme
MKSLSLKLTLIISFSILIFCSCEKVTDPPNIVILFIDDMGYGDPSCFGNIEIETPNIDRLASEGVVMTNFYTNSPICSPSRVALNTGQYPARHQVFGYFASKDLNRKRGMVDFLDPEVLTIAKVLKSKGYATAHFGKWHMGGGRDVTAPYPQEYGFDESLVSFEGMGNRIMPFGSGETEIVGTDTIWHVEKFEQTGIYVDRAIDFIKRNRENPFYLHVFPNDVHDRHKPDEESMMKYEAYADDPYKQKFYAVLDQMDRQIGRLTETIDNLGLAENTIIFFTSDNGPTDWPKYYAEGYVPPGSTGPFFGRKWSLYEGGIRMPFIVRWKGHIPEGVVNDQTIGAVIDLFPTILSLTNSQVPVSWDLDGEDISKAIYGEKVDRQRPVYWEYGGNIHNIRPGKDEHISPTNAMRDGDWK